MSPENHVRILNGLLHYHERMLLGEIRCGNIGEEMQNCPVKGIYDPYRSALQEAIRCVRIVHQLDDC